MVRVYLSLFENQFMKTKSLPKGSQTPDIGRWMQWLLFLSIAPGITGAPSLRVGPTVPLGGLSEAAEVARDDKGIAHIHAQNEHDLFFLQGYVHAQDRLFQMDMNRHLGRGALAELLGEAALPTDVQLRVIGLHRAAERTLPVLSPRVRAVLQAYADGVNACVRANPLPPEYAALELTRIEPWTPLDSEIIVKLITFDRAFELDVAPTVTLLTYQQAGQALGFDGTALFFEDLFRAAPFDPASTISDASVAVTSARTLNRRVAQNARTNASSRNGATLQLCRHYLNQIQDLPVFHRLLERGEHAGSNQWGVRGDHTVTGHVMIANDTHLSLGVPDLWHPIHLHAGRLNAAGSSVAGVPCVILGHNRHIAWGATTSYADVTDTFQEQILPDTNSPSGLSIVHAGQNEPIIPIPEVFRKNNSDGQPDNLTVVPPSADIQPATLIVPRRNHGPIVQLDLAHGTALSVQYTGFSPTRELEAFLAWNEAKGLEDFLEGLQFFDVGSINWACADTQGNLGFFSSSEVPVREDLQAGSVHGAPPFLIRDGTGGNEWLPVQHPQPGQAIPYEILPFEEMPHLLNPPAGWFVNCNNDPVGHTLDNNPLNQLRPGGGIFYLARNYEIYRAGRVTQLIRAKLENGGKISNADMRRIQSDTVLIDAQVFVPYIVTALANARSSAEPALAAFATDARVAEAVRRLGAWDFTTPTGIPEGYDAGGTFGLPASPSSTQIAASVAATIYAVWRGQIIRNTIDAPLAPRGLPVADDQHALAALRNLLEKFHLTGGVGASGLNFFDVPGVASPTDRRDVLILKSLSDALTLLAGDGFATAFAHSANPDDYRWGKLHRLVLKHPLGGSFNLPPAAGAWPSPLPGLEGLPLDGGFSTVDVGNPVGGVRGNDADAFMFDHGAAHRLIAEATPAGIRGEFSWPGGPSGVLGSPYYASALPSWLVNETFPVLLRNREQTRNMVTTFVPLE